MPHVRMLMHAHLHVSMYMYLLQSTGTATGWLKVWSLGFGIQSSEFIQNFTKVKRDRGFLDVGFSLCTVPTFCHSLVISDRSSETQERGSELQGE